MSLTDVLPYLALVAALGAAALVVVTTRATISASSQADEVRRREIRAAEMRSEAARLAAIRSETVAGAVDIGSAVARLGHETVAGLSFRLLDVATGGRTRRIKRRHDSIANAVYGAISEATGELRNRGAGGTTPTSGTTSTGGAGGITGAAPPPVLGPGPTDPAGPHTN